jgi:hypothetical protein
MFWVGFLLELVALAYYPSTRFLEEVWQRVVFQSVFYKQIRFSMQCYCAHLSFLSPWYPYPICDGKRKFTVSFFACISFIPSLNPSWCLVCRHNRSGVLVLVGVYYIAFDVFYFIVKENDIPFLELKYPTHSWFHRNTNILLMKQNTLL